jgi:anti-sigma regulatory factor (Ser/Thr protein kinase)
MQHVMHKRWDIGRNDHASSMARDLIAGALAPRAPRERVNDAVLLTSELVSNVWRHTAGPCVLTLRFDHSDDFVEVEVSDSAPDLPVNMIEQRPHTVGGFGLRLVDRIATKWGCTRNTDSKTVWFQLGDRTTG